MKLRQGIGLLAQMLQRIRHQPKLRKAGNYDGRSVVKINRQRVICPDNGLITWAWRLHENAKAYELTWRPEQSSQTFHGRDIMAPVAGMLARGRSIKSLTTRIDLPLLLDIKPATSKRGEVIHIDRFGNAITNFVRPPGSGSVLAGRKTFGVHRTYRCPVRKTAAAAGLGARVVSIDRRPGGQFLPYARPSSHCD